MPAIVLAAEQTVIPGWVVDQPSFCRWAFTDEFPHRGRFGYFNDSVWVSFEMETENHNQMKSMIAAVLLLWAQTRKLGRFYGDRMMLSQPAIGLATEPDGMFVSTETRRSGRVVVTRGSDDPGGSVILEGSPDMVLEVVSPGSVRKDTADFVDLYWQAGVTEYWLVDPRGKGEPKFTLYSHGPNGYRPVRAVGGWRKSSVFGTSFRLTRTTDELGLPTYALETR